MNDLTGASDCVLCVDLDGTFSQTDTLVELLLMLVKQSPLSLFLIPFWLLKGKAHFKAEVARRVHFDPAKLAYNAELVAWLRTESEGGRRIVLASGADERIVSAIAAHHGFFEAVLASDGRRNLTGRAKAAELRERFGRFAYIGNAKVDIPVWEAAEAALLSTRSPELERVLSRRLNFERVFRPVVAPSRAKLWFKALRVHQWVKNALMFVPIVLAHQLLNLEKLGTVAIGFIAFNLCASSVYLLNDLLDLGSDRAHPTKSLRPFAAATLPLEHGIAAIPLLLVASFGLAIYASPAFAAVLALYYLVTVAYSFDLKRRALIDVFTLASLYTLRIIAGAVAADVELSPWLLGFSIFLFLSLGIVKRVAELESGRARGIRLLAGRGYQIDDFAMLQMLGVASGYASVVVLALYVSAPDSKLLYRHHQLLWLFAPLVLFWISRVWLVTHRGEMHDDPIVYALKDPASRIVAVLAAAIFALAAF